MEGERVGVRGPFHQGAAVGLLGGLLATTTTGINYLFEKKSWKLFLINSGYNLVGFCIMGAVLSLI